MRVCKACSTETDDTGRFCPVCGAVFPDDARVSAAGATAKLEEPVQAAAASLVGTTIGDFVIDAILGGGAFGTVYRGRQLGLDRPIAIKVPTHEIACDPVMTRRFAREAKAAARVNHPGVVAIYGVGELADGRPYLAMQLVDGEPLDGILKPGPVTAARALRIARAVASALSDTHAADVVHRDLKPSNIMWRVDRNGDDRITLVDFGIAFAKPGNADATRLTTNGLVGTPNYMSPEQAHGEIVDARSDLYALGCILFELVTGQPPFAGSGFEVLLAHLGRPSPVPSEVNPEVPEVVDHLVRDLMHKKPDERPQSADAVVARIDDALAELAAGPAGSLARTTRARRSTARATRSRPAGSRSRYRLIAWGSLGLVALSAVALAVTQIALRSSSALAGAGAATADEDDGTASVFTGRQEVVVDDGEMSARVTLYDPIVAGTRTRTRFEVWNAIGAPLDVPYLVITITDASGNAVGVTAPQSKRTKGRFSFWHEFATPGSYVLRVFPPEAASVFTIEVVVEA